MSSVCLQIFTACELTVFKLYVPQVVIGLKNEDGPHIHVNKLREKDSPKAGPSHMDSQKTVVDGQLITIHSDSDDQVKTSLDMSASSSAKKRRAQLQMQSEANRDKRASERNALLKEFLDVLNK